jgi:hypothetical protein
LLGFEPCFVRNVFKLKSAFIEEEFVLAHISCHKHIREPVIIDITDGNAGAIVEVPVAKNVEILVILKGVGEYDAAVLYFLKHRVAATGLAASEGNDPTRDKDKSDHMGVIKQKGHCDNDLFAAIKLR